MELRLLGLVLWVSLATGRSDNIDTLLCPLPNGPNSSSEASCNLFTACQWSYPNCVMQNNSIAGYRVASAPVDTGRGFTVNLEKIDPSITMFDQDITNLVFEAIYHEDYHLQIKVYDADAQRYEVPLPLNLPSQAGSSPLYTVTVNDVGKPFTFSVIRNATGTNIFKTMGPLIFEDQFIQISTFLSSDYMYGLGENPHRTFKHSFAQPTTSPIFPRDQPVGIGDYNQYGYQPYYVNIEDDSGNTHSVLLYSSNAMEYTTFSTSDGQPAITYKTIGGIIDLHFFLGPFPEDVNEQYTGAIGSSNFPPYWSLGFILSRYGYNDIDTAKEVRQRMKDAGIPQDGQTFDIDYMDENRDFTYDPVNFAGLPEYINELQADGVRVTLMFDPALVIDFDNYPPSQRGLDQDVYVKWMSEDLIPDDQPTTCLDYMVGYVWPANKTIFPDFLYPPARDWWANELVLFHDTLNFDAIWIDMNEPSNFGTNLDEPFNYPPNLEPWSLKCPYNKYDSPPFPTKASYQDVNECKRISDKTLCMSGKQSNGTNDYLHYDVHSIYGITETTATQSALDQLFPGERHLLLSRSTFPGSGQWASHWLGDNSADWYQMQMSVVGLMEFSLFGINHAGADICGFFNEPSPELCTRWMQLGAFYPFSRNHNTIGIPPQDPARPDWPSYVSTISRDVLLLRYQYLPYLYTLFHKANMHGSSVVRPLFNAFPSDLLSRDIDTQFLWGSSLMIAPVLESATYSRDVYFPDARWYDLVEGVLVTDGPSTETVDAPLEKIPVYLRGGAILPFQNPEVTTDLSRTNPMGLTIALDRDGAAYGDIFWDDGKSVLVDPNTQAFMGQFNFEANILSMNIMHNRSVTDGLILESINFYGYPGYPTAMDLNGVPVTDFTYDISTDILMVTVSQPMSSEFNLTIS